jgi:hypothetical protein
VRRHLYIAVTAVVAAMLAATPVGAFASGAVLTSGAVGSNGSDVDPGVQLVAQSMGDATFASSDVSGAVTCSASSIAATVRTNPAAPGTATLSVTSFSFSGCTSSLAGTTGVDSVSFDNLPYRMSINDTASPTRVTVGPGDGGPIQLTILLRTAAKPVPCVARTRDSSMKPDLAGGGLAFDVALTAPVNGVITEPCLHALVFRDRYGGFVDLGNVEPVFVN